MIKQLTSYCLCGIFFLFGCNGQTEKTIVEQAEKKIQHAAAQIHDNDPAGAEQSMVQAIELLTSVNNRQKLVEAYTSLASLQLSLGKPSAALSSYVTVRNFYGQIADRSSEIPVMVEIGKLYFQLGMVNDASKILEEALLSSQLYQFSHYHAEVSLELGRIYGALGKFQRSNSYFTQAGREFLQSHDTANVVESLLGKITSLVKAKKIIEAKETYNNLELILMKDLRADYVAHAFTECGGAFSEAQEWDLAHRLFVNSILTASNARTEDGIDEITRAHAGLGELYFKNYDFSDAQNEFINAYNSQKNKFESMFEAYLVTRIADCNVKQYAVTPTQDALIRASQMYEKALSIFSRFHLGIGEAIILHRIGMQKEINGDDNAAMTYYKRAIEKFCDNNIPLQFIPADANIALLISTGTKRHALCEWLTERLTGLLLKYRRTEEALKYSILSTSYHLCQKISLNDIQFKDSQKKKAFEQYAALQTTKNRLLLEITYASAEKNKNYTEQLIQQRWKMEKERPSFPIDQFASLKWLTYSIRDTTFAVRPQNSSFVMLHFQVINNECWVYVIDGDREVSSVKLSAYGYELQQKMYRFIELQNNPNKNLQEINLLSEDLYKILILPLEKFGRQRFVIIPIDGLEKFPFHALTKNGRLLVEMIEVSYLPSPLCIKGLAPVSQTFNTIAAFGFTSDSRWGLEFELRDIRSFFRDVRISLNQNATKDVLQNSTGEMLQISSMFRSTADNDYFVTLSDGSASTAGITVPISFFTSLSPFPLVYLSDVQSHTNNIDVQHVLYWLMNDASGVITTEFPIDARTGKLFEENFYSSLSSTNNPYQSYRQAVLQLSSQNETASSRRPASFFYYGF